MGIRYQNSNNEMDEYRVMTRLGRQGKSFRGTRNIRLLWNSRLILCFNVGVDQLSMSYRALDNI